MNTKRSVERDLAGETEIVGENWPQYYFIQHKSRVLIWSRTRVASMYYRLNY
jgi:hypothetical protein